MKIHVLPGDALTEEFIRAEFEADEIVFCRECLIEGAVESDDLENFWKIRARFIRSTYNEPEISYRQKVVGEFEKLQNLKSGDAVYLWFEYDLFCQANMWFCLFLLERAPIEIYRVAPVVRNENDIWKGFGKLSVEGLRECFARKIRFVERDVSLGARLWKAYQIKDYDEITKLGETESGCFPKLREVCAAEIEKERAPQKILKSIAAEGTTDFSKMFEKFSEKAGVYGYGDSQVKNIYNRLRE